MGRGEGQGNGPGALGWQISNLSDESYQFPGRMQKEGKTQVATATKRPSQLFLQNIRQTQFDLEV